ncbi:hypothetical protein Cgig2_012238 [Carnegiea gigantea]|uniref:Uncharacterized protein n=1 Tax=Carnegiea gigantea TaxID=171969 RepID=A0A9Q1GYR5_9CARY|nr:hypothetical protein Cgig2_012238 [Carnegiea gigantea]
MTLEAEVSSSSGDVVKPELWSKKFQDKHGSSKAHTRTSKNRGDVAVTELRSKKVHDKGGYSKLQRKWSSVLKYKSFVMDRHLVRTFVESWNPDTKAFKIVRMEVPFSVYEVCLLTSLPTTGKHVTFEWGQDLCEVEEVVWFYEYTNLCPQADDKCVSRIASWVNLYIGHKYDATVLISSIKDNQVGQRLSCCVTIAKDVEDCEQLFEQQQPLTMRTVGDIIVNFDMLRDKGSDIDEQAEGTEANVLSMPECNMQLATVAEEG